MYQNNKLSSEALRISSCKEVYEFYSVDGYDEYGPLNEDWTLLVMDKEGLVKEYVRSSQHEYSLEKVWSMDEFLNSTYYHNCFKYFNLF